MNLVNVLKPFIGKDLWVALDKSQEKVIASGGDIEKVVEEAKKVTGEKPVLMRTKQDYQLLSIS